VDQAAEAVAAQNANTCHVGERMDAASRRALLQRPVGVPCQNPFIAADLAFRAPLAALRYSLIRPPRTCLRSIWTVISTARPPDRYGDSRSMILRGANTPSRRRTCDVLS